MIIPFAYLLGIVIDPVAYANERIKRLKEALGK